MGLQETLASELTERSIDNILQFRENVAEGLRNPTLEDKPRWLEILQVTGRVERQIVLQLSLADWEITR